MCLEKSSWKCIIMDRMACQLRGLNLIFSTSALFLLVKMGGGSHSCNNLSVNLSLGLCLDKSF